MRTIRFRAWDKLTKTMRYGAENNLVVVLNNPDFEVMQYTNLKDKKGKEIFEGDIVRDEFSNLEVVWHSKTGTWGFNKKHRGTADVFSLAMLEPHLKLEIIGNIYENPELL